MDLRSLGLPLFVAALMGASALAAGAVAPRSSAEAPGSGPAPPAHPERMVSTNLPTDEILLALVSPARIAAVSHFADHPAISNVRREARAVPHRVRGEAEPILALRPDLVFAFPFGQGDTETLLRQASVPVVHVPGADRLEDIRTNVRRIGDIVGAPERAEALLDDMDGTLAAVRARVRGARRPRVLLWHVTGSTAGSDTLFDDLVQAAGGRNAAAEAGIVGLATLPLERVLAIDPDVVFVLDFRDDGRAREVAAAEGIARDSRWQAVRAVRNERLHVLAANHAYASSHHAAKAAIDMARRLHPGRFTGGKAKP
ncbi:MAG: ABC transporter substrate-binding protein [Myxococcota bacterium]